MVSRKAIEPSETTVPNARKPVARTRIFGLLLLLAIVGALLAGILPRLQHRTTFAADARGIASEHLPVHVVEAKAAGAGSDLTLPGSTQAIEEAPIYARVSGYITHRYTDIGDKVKAGQMLAEIDAPELDQELMQARATAAHSLALLGQARASLVQSQAKMTLAKETLARWVTLAARGVVSHQEKDQRQSDFDSAAAEVEALKIQCQRRRSRCRCAKCQRSPSRRTHRLQTCVRPVCRRHHYPQHRCWQLD